MLKIEILIIVFLFLTFLRRKNAQKQRLHFYFLKIFFLVFDVDVFF